MTTWIYDNAIDPKLYHSFVYRIDFTDGTFYIGKRKLWVERAKVYVRESDWEDYWTSSKAVKDKVKLVGKSNVKRTILSWCVSAMDASWQELKATVPLFEDPLCMNEKLLPNYRKKVLDNLKLPARRQQYLDEVAKKSAKLQVP